MSEKRSIVIDAGSEITKCGFGGEDGAEFCFPSCVGRPKHVGIMVGMDGDNSQFVGDDAISKRNILKIKYPIEHGFVTNWNDMENIWNYAYDKELKIKPSEHSILLSETPLNPKNNREKMCSIQFETFKVPSLLIINSSVLSLYASGRTTGLVLDSGHSVTNFVPIYEGYSLPHATIRMNMGGRDVTDYLIKLLGQRGYEMILTSEREIVNEIKKMCFCAYDYESELKKYVKEPLEKEFILPDETKVMISSELFRAPEIMFKPSFIGSEVPGIHEFVVTAMNKCDIDVRKDFKQNIVLAGGNTLFENFVPRLSDEVQMITSKHSKVKVNAPTERKHSAWIGGSIISNLNEYKNEYISNEEYEEFGSSIVHRKCFY